MPADIHHLGGVGLKVAIEVPPKDMVKLVLGQAAVRVLGAVEKAAELGDFGGEAQLLTEAALRGGFDGLVGTAYKLPI